MNENGLVSRGLFAHRPQASVRAFCAFQAPHIGIAAQWLVAVSFYVASLSKLGRPFVTGDFLSDVLGVSVHVGLIGAVALGLLELCIGAALLSGVAVRSAALGAVVLSTTFLAFWVGVMLFTDGNIQHCACGIPEILRFGMSRSNYYLMRSFLFLFVSILAAHPHFRDSVMRLNAYSV